MSVLANAGDTAQGIGGIALVIGGIFLYILPTLIASRRRAASLSPVTVVNIFLGWTVIGWVVALAMAVSGPNRRPPKPPKPGWKAGPAYPWLPPAPEPRYEGYRPQWGPPEPGQPSPFEQWPPPDLITRVTGKPPPQMGEGPGASQGRPGP